MTAGGSAVPFADALRLWFKVGCLGFGGPAGQIALLHRLVVDEKKWVDEPRFLHALNFCMLLPGPEAQQLATYLGWLLHGLRGGLAAGILFVLPGALVVLGLSALYAGLAEVPLVAAAFLGVKAAVLAVVIEALLRIAKRALKAEFAYLLAAAAFLAIFVFDLPFPLVVIAAGLIGYVIGARRPSLLGLAPAVATGAVIAPGQARRTIATALLWLAVWLVPVALLHVALGGDHVFAAIARFFSVMAVVTFGGAYAVLAYVAQQAVEVYGWLTATEMIDGLGLAETTPGPLILVNQFVGFLAGFRALTGIDPWLAGALGAATTIYVTFVPSFLWIFAGAPYIEALRGRPALSGALAAITAAVVGVILNLALWFALHVVFGVVHERAWPELGIALAWPDWGSLQPFVLGLALASMVAMFGLKIGMLPTLALAAAAGIASYFLA